MARRPRPAPKTSSESNGERLAVVEALFQRYLETWEANVEAIVERVTAKLATQAAVDALAARVTELEHSKERAAGSYKVESRHREFWEKVAEKALPYVITALGGALGWRWIDGAG